MNAQWQVFLLNAGAEVQDGYITHFGNPAQETQILTTGTVICDLSHHCLIKVTGRDAQDFLQAQLTNDLLKIVDGGSQLSAYCNAKGRVIFTLRVLIFSGDIYLQIPFSMQDIALDTLQRYKLRSEVSFDVVDTQLICIGIAGSAAEKHLQELLHTIPESVNTYVEVNDLCVVKVPGASPRFQIYGALPAMKKLWQGLHVHAVPVGSNGWNLLDILAGIPNIYAATTAAFVPQMLNLQLIKAMSFTKGCYPGQEVAARLQNQGQLKRRMYLIEIKTQDVPLAASNIVCLLGPTTENVGQIIDAVPCRDDKVCALAVLEIKHVENDPDRLRLHDGNGAVVTISPQPYALDAS